MLFIRVYIPKFVRLHTLTVYILSFILNTAKKYHKIFRKCSRRSNFQHITGNRTKEVASCQSFKQRNKIVLILTKNQREMMLVVI